MSEFAERDSTEELESRLDRFEVAWQGSSIPDILSHLPEVGHPARRETLVEMIKVDVEYRWRRFGNSDSVTEKDNLPLRPCIEDYLRLFPELQSNDDVLVELLREEYRVRRRFDEKPDHANYVTRFPHLETLLPRQLASVDEECQGDAASIANVTPGPDEPTPFPEASVNATANATPTEDSPELPVLMPTIGRYRVVRMIGHGSFGRVYLAQDDQLQRHVAIKVPYQEFTRSSRAENYLAEARIAARLDHPTIVPVYDFGQTENGQCYVVSKYISGSDLSSAITERRVDFAEAAEMVASVADALSHAHRLGLVHRDVKPANLLLDANGRVYLADFGLALTEEDFGTGPTFTGTPAYMSPEQARGEGHLVDGRSDVFSLGAVLYELLSGVRPFRGERTSDVLRLIKTVEVRPPRQFDETIPRELERICLKALSLRAADRYATAHDFSEDLRHWVADASKKTTEERDQERRAAVRPGSTVSSPIAVVPKGLRSFDHADADFFLSLLPGPRDRTGLPDSLRFWKTRIEDDEFDEPFRVGLIYGPSGCGKSSFVKAGLLPRVDARIHAVYVEATGDATEERVRRRIVQRFEDLESATDLVEVLSRVRRGQALPPGEKLLLVIDQFEQSLQSSPALEMTGFVEAIRQCDGRRVQAILLIRDDFWMATTRFLRQVEVLSEEGRNRAAVDLFDVPHARNVLMAYGRAYNRLPERARDMDDAQGRFLDEAVAGLANAGRVVPVRLSLFAEMVKDKEWTSSTLKQLGGMRGIGAQFLEETFGGPHAPPENRMHQKGARRVLAKLLPHAGGLLKGSMQSYATLRDAAEYSDDASFERLLHLLDELRLITATDPEDEGVAGADGQFFQLTHDYLVPALREWLNRGRRSSARGRAEILLEERADEWGRSRSNRALPTWMEWIRIGTLTSRSRRTDAQREMMRRANKVYAVRGTLWSAALILVIAFTQAFEKSSYEWLRIYENTERPAAVRNEAFDQLPLNDSETLQNVIGTLPQLSDRDVVRHVVPRLVESVRSAPDSQELTASLTDSLRELTVDETVGVRRPAIKAFVQLASIRDVLAHLPRVAEEVPESLENEDLTSVLKTPEFGELFQDDTSFVIRSLFRMLERLDDTTRDSWNRRKLSNLYVSQLDRLDPALLLSELRKAFRRPNSSEVASALLASYVAVTADFRRSQLAATVMDALKRLLRQLPNEVQNENLNDNLLFSVTALGVLVEYQETGMLESVDGLMNELLALEEHIHSTSVYRAIVLVLDRLHARMPLEDRHFDRYGFIIRAEGGLTPTIIDSLVRLNDPRGAPYLQAIAVSGQESVRSRVSAARGLGTLVTHHDSLRPVLRETVISILEQFETSPPEIVNFGLSLFGPPHRAATVDDMELILTCFSKNRGLFSAYHAALALLDANCDSREALQQLAEVFLRCRGQFPEARLDRLLVTGDLDRDRLDHAVKQLAQAVADVASNAKMDEIRNEAESFITDLVDDPTMPAFSTDEPDHGWSEWRTWWDGRHQQLTLRPSGKLRVVSVPTD